MIYFLVFFLLFLSAIFSGLTLGFFSLNKDDLERKASLGGKRAKKIYEIRKNGNLLLCTLIIGNVIVNSTLSIFLGSIIAGWLAVLIAVSLIVFFGEIIPQAILARHALTVGAKFIWLVKLFLFILYPITKPIAWILNKALGEEIGTYYSKHELIKIIESQESGGENYLNQDAKKIAKGALSFSDKKVKDIMTPRVSIFSLSEKEKISQKLLSDVFQSGYSRIPVYRDEVDNIVNILYIRDLALLKKKKGMTVADIVSRKAFYIDEKKPLNYLFKVFREKKCHLFVALDDFGGVSGVVTIEDVIEEIVGEEIVDEYDKAINNREEARKKLKKKIKNKA